jgi:hypothetical protein
MHLSTFGIPLSIFHDATGLSIFHDKSADAKPQVEQAAQRAKLENGSS